MNPELEALIVAVEAVIEARGGVDAEKLEAIYQAKLDTTLARRPEVSRDRLVRAVDLAHRKWRQAADKKHSSLPPKA